VNIYLIEEILEVYIFGVMVLQKSMSKGEKKDNEIAKDKEKKKNKKFSFRLEYIKPILRFLYKSIRTFSIKKLNLKLTLGLEDAYETGVTCGYLYAILYPLNALQNVHVLVTPNFDTLVLDGRLDIDITNKASRLISPVFGLSSDIKLRKKLVEKIKNVV